MVKVGRRGWVTLIAVVAISVGCECPPVAEPGPTDDRGSGLLLIAGSVVDFAGEPVADAVVRGWGVPDSWPIEMGEVDRVTTDVAGRFRTRWTESIYGPGTSGGLLILNVTPDWYSDLEIVVDSFRVTFYDAHDSRWQVDTAEVAVVLPRSR